MSKSNNTSVRWILFLCLAVCIAGVFNADASQESADTVKITILYDNYVHTEGTKADWGFSCLIQGAEKTILFDAGTKPDILWHNIETLGVDISQVDIIVISHNHGDHTGGLPSVLEKLPPVVPVYAPSSYLGETVESKKDQIKRQLEPSEVCENVFLTGEMGDAIKEQALILKGQKETVLITGCAHPGIVSIIEQAKSVVNKNIDFAFGGFHLMAAPDNQVHSIIGKFKQLGVTRCGATHCTGPEAINLFKAAYEDNYVPMGVGRIITIN
jgi:7,8-dihydropterin-6-yl-methyl-4-(beta-D-ribofuranosyl)aminobenzene 5'-phosphate synthase